MSFWDKVKDFFKEDEEDEFEEKEDKQTNKT